MAQVRIKTVNNVEIAHETSDIGNRILAYLIDVMLIAAVSAIPAFLFSSNEEIGELFSVIILFFYDPVICTINEGQTVGKKVIGLRVIKLDGSQANFGTYIIRQLLMLVDATVCGIVGLITASTSEKNQRVGDMVAGTVVVKTDKHFNTNIQSITNQNTNQNTNQTAESIYKPMFDKVVLLSTDDSRVIKEVIERHERNPNPELLSRTATKLKTILQVENTLFNDIDFLHQVQKDYNYLINKK